MNPDQPSPDNASALPATDALVPRSNPIVQALKRVCLLGAVASVFLSVIVSLIHLGAGNDNRPPPSRTETPRTVATLPELEVVVPKAVISPEFTGDEAYLLIRLLEQHYADWPSDVSDPDAFYASTYEMRRQATRLRARAEKAGLPPVITGLYGDYIQSLADYVSFLERLGVIRATVREATHNANMDAATRSISGVFDAIDSGGAPSAGATSAAIIVGGIDFGVQAWRNAKLRDAAETKLITEEARRITEHFDGTLTKARQAILDLGKERGWTRAEIGWDLNPATADQLARLSATNDPSLIHRELKRYVEFRPRDPLIRLASNYHHALSVQQNATTLRQLAEDCLDTLNLIPDEDVYADYRHHCTDLATYIALLARHAELKAGAALQAPSAAGERALEIAEYGLAKRPADASGMLRLLVAYAHLARGKVELAQTQAEALYSILGEDTVYQGMLADIYSQAGNWDRALRSLAASIVNGHFTTEEITDNWFLIPVRKARKGDFDKLTTPQWSWGINYGLINDDIWLRNDTFYPVSNVQLMLDLAKGQQTWTPTLTVDVLQPGETKVWKSVVSIPGSQLTQKRAQLNCDQNRAASPMP